jgi:Protein of unknown function (DUF3102)
MSDQPDKPSSLAEQINVAHREVVKAFAKGSLDYAIKAGELLILAKENVKAEKGKWLTWLAENCPNIPQTTASLYMRLAANKEVFRNQQRVANLAAQGDLSLRKALTLIPKTPEQQEKAAAAAKLRQENKAAAATKSASKSSTTIGDLLPNTAPDELFIAVRHAWDEDDLAKLANLLTNYLRSKSQPSVVPMPSVQPDRRV